jgi:acyl dehydratase
MTRYADDVTVGEDLPPLVRGPITTAHIMRWSAATENWHRIHYDWRYATGHDHLPDVVVNGSWRQHVLIQLVHDWATTGGWVRRIGFQFRGLNLPGETLTAWGRVTSLERRGEWGLASIDLGVRNDAGTEGTPGTASVVLPRRGGPAVPYPFDPGLLDQ